MTRFFSYTLTTLLLLGLISCNFSANDGFAKYRTFLKEELKNLDTLCIDNTQETTIIKFSDALEEPEMSLDIEFIKLETHPDGLIGYVGKIMHDDDKFFICDNINHSLFIFSEDGRFIHRIHNVGNGPGEYNKLTDFTLDKKSKRIVLYDAQKKRYYYHKYDGSFIESKTFGFWFREFCITPSGNYLLFTNNGNGTGFRLFETDSTGINIIRKAILSDQYYKMNAYATPHLDAFNDEILISFPFLYDIYSLKNDSLYCKYKLDLEGKDYTYDWVEPKGYHEYMDLFRNSNKEFDYGGSCIENNQFALFFLHTKEVGESQVLALNKSTNSVHKTRLTIPHSNLFLYPVTSISNRFVAAVLPHDLIEHGIHENYNEIRNIQESDNPCLVLFSIKTH